MPPKGWRKNAEGKFPSAQKESEPVSIDSLLFPKSVVAKLAKNITQADDANMILSKDSLTAVQRSATVFVSHLLFHAREVANDAQRKNANAQDIIQALERAELGGFIPEIKQKLTQYELNVEAGRKLKAQVKSGEEVPASKKLKDNQEGAVSKSEENADEESDAIEDDEEEDDTHEDGVQENTNENGIEADDTDNNEQASQNPIAALGKDEHELGGEENDDNKPENEDDSDGDSDE